MQKLLINGKAFANFRSDVSHITTADLNTQALLLKQASNLDLFSATQPNKFAETLSFLLEF